MLTAFEVGALPLLPSFSPRLFPNGLMVQVCRLRGLFDVLSQKLPLFKLQLPLQALGDGL